jgi:hypothetical protein
MPAPTIHIFGVVCLLCSARGENASGTGRPEASKTHPTFCPNWENIFRLQLLVFLNSKSDKRYQNLVLCGASVIIFFPNCEISPDLVTLDCTSKLTSEKS